MRLVNRGKNVAGLLQDRFEHNWNDFRLGFRRARQRFDHAQHPQRAGDDEGLMLDPVGVAIIFGGRHPPAAPIDLVGDDHRIAPGEWMRLRRMIVIAAIAHAADPPGRTLQIILVNLGFGHQFRGAELASQTHFVEDLDRLLHALHPVRHDAFDRRPCGDRFHEHPLPTMEQRFGHARSFPDRRIQSEPACAFVKRQGERG